MVTFWLLALVLWLAAGDPGDQLGSAQRPKSCVSTLDLVIFGDFLSSPGYPGPRWPDSLGAASVANYATTTGTMAGDVLNVSCLAWQVQNYLLENPVGATAPTCVAIWMGAYDIYQMVVAQPTDPSSLDDTDLLTAVIAMKQALQDAVQQLLSANVRCLYMFTQLDEMTFPAMQAAAAINPSLSGALQLSVDFSNSVILDSVDKFRRRGMTVTVVNSSNAFADAEAQAQAESPPWNVTPCYTAPPLDANMPCDKAVWYDTMNPTPAFQQLLAVAISRQICAGQEPDNDPPSHFSYLWLMLLLLLTPVVVGLGWCLCRPAPTPPLNLQTEMEQSHIITVVKDPAVDPQHSTTLSPPMDLAASLGSTTLRPDPSGDSSSAPLCGVSPPSLPQDAGDLRSPELLIQGSGSPGDTRESLTASLPAGPPPAAAPDASLRPWVRSLARSIRPGTLANTLRGQNTVSHATYSETDNATLTAPGYEAGVCDMLDEYLDIPVPRVEVGVHKRQGLGQGTSGQVFTGTHLKKGTTVAIKVIAAMPSLMERVKQEVQRLYALRHPNIVRCFGYFLSPGSVNIVMEYVPRTLGQAIRELHQAGCMGEAVIKEYSTQILRGIEYIHGCNIIHRDLKPANILIDTHGVCKIADFGSSKMLSDLTATLPSCAGTPQYMAPEVMFGGAALFGSDVWSFACIVYEMFEGQAPWHQLLANAEICSVAQFFIQVSRVGGTPLRPDDHIPRPAVEFLAPCFAYTAEERPTCRELLGRPWLVRDPGDEEDTDWEEPGSPTPE